MENVAEIKTGLHQVIAETDDIDTLTKIKHFVSGLIESEQKIVAYSHKGEPLTPEQYKANIDAAIQESNAGQVVSVDEMEREI